MTVVRGEVLASSYENISAHARKAPADPDRYLNPRVHDWAQRIRAQMGWAACAEPGHRVNTPFRRQQRMVPVDECVLRDLARRQVAAKAVSA